MKAGPFIAGACLTPQALQSVAGPSGPFRHIGVTVAPHRTQHFCPVEVKPDPSTAADAGGPDALRGSDRYLRETSTVERAHMMQMGRLEGSGSRSAPPRGGRFLCCKTLLPPQTESVFNLGRAKPREWMHQRPLQCLQVSQNSKTEAAAPAA